MNKPSLKSLDQQVIVITGASSGIGLATALAASRQGARLVLAARSRTTLEDIARLINADAGQAIACSRPISGVWCTARSWPCPI